MKLLLGLIAAVAFAQNPMFGPAVSGAGGTTNCNDIVTNVTGTGNCVKATSPTLVTPILGVATATSLAINGATIGSNALAVTGTANISGAITLGSLTSSRIPFAGTLGLLGDSSGLTFTDSGTIRDFKVAGGSNDNIELYSQASGSNEIDIKAGGNNMVSFSYDRLRIASGYYFGWGNSTTGYSTLDTSLSRVSAGVIGVGTGAAASVAGTLSAASYLAAAGSVGTPSIQLGGDTTTGLYRPAANQVALSISGAQFFKATGTAGSTFLFTDPTATTGQLSVVLKGGAVTNTKAFDLQNAAGTSQVYMSDTGNLTVAGNGTFSGSVGVGTASPTRQVQIYGLGQATAALTDAGNTGGTLLISDSGAAVGNGGALTFSAAVANGQMAQAAIKTLLQNGATNGGSDLAFSTRNAATDTALTERMRILGAGCLAINMVTCGTSGVLNTTGKIFHTGLTASSGTPNSVCINSSTKEVTENGALTCTTSSRDYKTGIGPLTASDPTALLMGLKPSIFAYKDTPDRARWGFIAEEVADVDHKLGDGYDAAGVARSLDQNAILALAIQVIQKQQIEIDALKKAIQ